MPVVRIDLWEGRDGKIKEELIRRVTETVAQTLEIAEKSVWVILDETPKAHWGIGGKLGTEFDPK